jgi:hypothetical protein
VGGGDDVIRVAALHCVLRAVCPNHTLRNVSSSCRHAEHSARAGREMGVGSTGKTDGRDGEGRRLTARRQPLHALPDRSRGRNETERRWTTASIVYVSESRLSRAEPRRENHGRKTRHVARRRAAGPMRAPSTGCKPTAKSYVPAVG